MRSAILLTVCSTSVNRITTFKVATFKQSKFQVKKVWAQAFFGGVAAFSREQIMAVNGHSTEFWGWGKEGAQKLCLSITICFDGSMTKAKDMTITQQMTTSGSALQEQGGGLRSVVLTRRAWTAFFTLHTSRVHLYVAPLSMHMGLL